MDLIMLVNSTYYEAVTVYFLHPLISSVLSQSILLSTSFLRTLSLCSYLNV